MFTSPEATAASQSGAEHAEGGVGCDARMEEVLAWSHSPCLLHIYVCQSRSTGMEESQERREEGKGGEGRGGEGRGNPHTVLYYAANFAVAIVIHFPLIFPSLLPSLLPSLPPSLPPSFPPSLLLPPSLPPSTSYFLRCSCSLRTLPRTVHWGSVMTLT